MRLIVIRDETNLQLIIGIGMIRVLSDGELLVHDRREEPLHPFCKLIQRLPAQDHQHHQVGRVVGGVETKKLLPHINPQFSRPTIQSFKIS